MSSQAPTIAAIVLTFNEEKHIGRCLRSLEGICREVWVIDSFSTDRTAEIARSMGARVVEHAFENQAQQFNWAISGALPIEGDWLWRVDADEYVSADLGRQVCAIIASCEPDVTGIYVNKRIVFMGRPLRHGGWYPAPQIKVIRRGHGESEHKVMDEHLVVTDGRTVYADGDQTDENLNGLTWWTDKHNRYATREAVNMLLMQYGMDTEGAGVAPRLFGNDAERKRWLKVRYVKAPLFVRPFVNFTYRYILKLGFLDGRAGFVWHILQGFWYRMLVDAKIYELRRSLGNDEGRLRAHLRENYLTAERGG